MTNSTGYTSRAFKFPRTPQTVFLDRDGVVNRKMPEGRYVTRWEEFDLLPGVVEAIAGLKRAGLRVIVVSNQRGIALGLYKIEDVQGIHARFQDRLKEQGAYIDGFYFCPHDKGACDCRKPLPGLFLQSQRDFPAIEAASSVMIGDSDSDIEFGHRLDMTTAFIEGPAQHQKPGAPKAAQMADLHYASLIDAVEDLLKRLENPGAPEPVRRPSSAAESD